MRKKLVNLSIITSIFVLAIYLGSLMGNNVSQAKAGGRYEYLVVFDAAGSSNLDKYGDLPVVRKSTDIFNKMSKKGWEYVDWQGANIVFRK